MGQWGVTPVEARWGGVERVVALLCVAHALYGLLAQPYRQDSSLKERTQA